MRFFWLLIKLSNKHNVIFQYLIVLSAVLTLISTFNAQEQQFEQDYDNNL